MKYFNSTLTFIIVLGCISPLKCQKNNTPCEKQLLADRNSSTNIAAQVYTDAYPSYPEQFYNNWQTADVYFTNGKVAKNQLIRYNGYEDEMIWKRVSDKKVGSIIKSTVSEVRFYPGNGKQQLFRKMNITLPMALKPSDIYINVLVEGKLSLYCYRKVKMVKNTPELFYNDYQYVIKKNREFIPISLRRSDILGLFTTRDERKAFRTFMHEKGWKFRKEQDVIRALNQYNLKDN